MLDVIDLSLHFGERAIAKSLSFSVRRKERAGLAGKNGAGKSTLLKLIAGELKPDSGQISIEKRATIGYLHQDLNSLTDKSIRNEIKSALSILESLKHEYENIQNEMAERTDYESDSYMDLLDRFDQVQTKYLYYDPDQIEKQIELIAMGLGFKREQLDESVEILSGGWKMRVELAKLLIQKPDLLLLDEPTNHLDIESIMWMEEWLNGYDGASIIISHDIEFLNNTTTRTLEIVNGKIRDYPFPYTKYKRVRAEEMEQLQNAYDNQQRLIKQKEQTIDRFKAKATKAKMAQSMIKELERMDRLDPPDEDSKLINIKFPDPTRSGAVVYEAHNLGHAYDDNQVFSGLNIKIERGDRIAFVGQNGQGKSTLAKIIAGELTPSEGQLKKGHNVDLGYFAQNQAEKLNPNQTVQEVAESAASHKTLSKVRSILGAFLFPGEEVEKKVNVLSGGERSRLAISLLMHDNYNVLLLDEPTNHLDIYSKEVLKTALQTYDGTLLIISHDRSFLNDLTQKTLSFRDGEIKLHLDNVETYLKNQRIQDMRALEMNSQKNSNSKPTEKKKVSKSNITEDEKRAIRKKASIIEREITKLDSRLEKIEYQMSAKDFYESEDAERIGKKYSSLKQEQEEKEEEWERLVSELDG